MDGALENNAAQLSKESKKIFGADCSKYIRMTLFKPETYN
jgi:hypothetical protein